MGRPGRLHRDPSFLALLAIVRRGRLGNKQPAHSVAGVGFELELLLKRSVALRRAVAGPLPRMSLPPIWRTPGITSSPPMATAASGASYDVALQPCAGARQVLHQHPMR